MIRSGGLSSLIVLTTLLTVSDQGRADFVTAQSWGWYRKTSTTASRNDPSEKDYLTGKTGSIERRAYFEFQLTSGAAQAQLWLYLPNPDGYTSASSSEAITLYSVSNAALNPSPSSFDAGQVFIDLKDGPLSNPFTIGAADEGTWIGIPLLSSVSAGQLIVGIAMENVSTSNVNQYVFGGTSPDPFPLGSITPRLGLGPNSSPPLPFAPVPEPGGLTLVGVAALGAISIARRKWKRPPA